MIGTKTNFLYYQDYPWSLFDKGEGMTNSSNFNDWKDQVIENNKVKTPPEISLSFINQRLFIPFKINGLCKRWELRTEIQPTLGFVLPQVGRLYLKSKLYTDTKKYQTTNYIVNGTQEDLSNMNDTKI
ncbi:hypothetical protein ACTFIZ_007781 [Dictyostelium cf. discoideum]